MFSKHLFTCRFNTAPLWGGIKLLKIQYTKALKHTLISCRKSIFYVNIFILEET